MLPMVLALNVPNAMYAFLALTKTTSIVAVVATVVLEQFGYGFGFAAFLIFLIYTAEGISKTSHYAIATGFMALGMMLPGMARVWRLFRLGGHCRPSRPLPFKIY